MFYQIKLWRSLELCCSANENIIAIMAIMLHDAKAIVVNIFSNVVSAKVIVVDMLRYCLCSWQ